MSNENQRYYKQLSPYETMKKQLWSQKMTSAMPLWSAFTASIAAQLANLSNDDLAKSTVLLQNMQQEADQYVIAALETDKIYHASLVQAAMLDQAGKAGLDLDNFKNSMKSALSKTKTKKPKASKPAKKKGAKRKNAK